ncbi:MAG: ABC transporter permease subunit [Phormidesmis sp.]
MAEPSSNTRSGWQAWLRDERFWQIAFQIILIVVVGAAFSFLFGNLSRNMARQGIQFGFGFFQNPAGFGIREDLLAYQPQESYAKVVQAGIVNSLRLVFVGIITATIAGVAAGVASFSDNWLVFKLSRAYVGLVRNVPLLLQLFLWFYAVILALPSEQQNPIVLPNANTTWLIASNSQINIVGPNLPDPVWVGLMLLLVTSLLLGLLWRSVSNFMQGRFAAGIAGWAARAGNAAVIVGVLFFGYLLLFSNSAQDQLFFQGALISLFTNPEGLWIMGLMAAFVAIVLLYRQRMKVMLERGADGKVFLYAMIAIAVAMVAVVLFAFNWTPPELRRIEIAGNVRTVATGGLRMTGSYAAALIGLTFYTGAFIAEIVRAGIQSVSRGQWEAARSVGLSNGQAMQLVIFPQSLRVIIPPLNSEFANLAKNSSLAFAVGYPELYNIANTTLNQTGRPIEVFLVMMATYLTLNLLISLNMNQLNNAVQFKER